MLSLVVAFSAFRQPQPVVKVDGLGTATGIMSTLDRSVATFLGLPYAEAPVGKMRYQPPQPHAPWAAPLDATDFGSMCVQRPDAHHEKKQMSEDCLFLNVFTPAAALSSSVKLPVMLWIHGGAYQSGAANDGIYRGDALVSAANQSVVAVTINYRLNVPTARLEPAVS